MNRKHLYSTNQDIRDYMTDHGVSQKALAEQIGMSAFSINTMLKKELSEKQKEELIRHIDAIAGEPIPEQPEETAEETSEVEQTKTADDETVTTKFQIGDRVKIPSKTLCIGIVCDIWHSMIQDKVLYAVDREGGSRGLYTADQLEPAPLPITFRFESYIEGNVAVTTMIATQGDKTWVYARGHAHILHDGEVGMAQAVSYSARRMFESLDSKQENKIYLKEDRR